jgi:hypothetical protein
MPRLRRAGPRLRFLWQRVAVQNGDISKVTRDCLSRGQAAYTSPHNDSVFAQRLRHRPIPLQQQSTPLGIVTAMVVESISNRGMLLFRANLLKSPISRIDARCSQSGALPPRVSSAPSPPRPIRRGPSKTRSRHDHLRPTVWTEAPRPSRDLLWNLLGGALNAPHLVERHSAAPARFRASNRCVYLTMASLTGSQQCSAT